MRLGKFLYISWQLKLLMLFIQFPIPNGSTSWTILWTRSQNSCSVAIIAVSLVHLIIPRRFRMSLNNGQQNYLCMSVCVCVPMRIKSKFWESLSRKAAWKFFGSFFTLAFLWAVVSYSCRNIQDFRHKSMDISQVAIYKDSVCTYQAFILLYHLI